MEPEKPSFISAYKNRVKLAFRNLGQEFRRWHENSRTMFTTASLPKKLVFAGAAATGVGASWYIWGPVGVATYLALESMTFISFGLNQGISRGVQDTKQKQVLFMLPNANTGLQSLLSGGYSRALMGMNGVLMNLVSSITPDSVLDAKKEDGTSKRRRLKLGLVFSAATIGGSLAIAKRNSLWEVIPAVSSTMVVITSVMASSIKSANNRDPQVRGLAGASQFLNSFYSAFHLGLPVKTLTDLLDAQAHASALMKFHVPILDAQGRKISTPKRLQYFFERAVQLKQIPGFTPMQLAHPNKAEEEEIAQERGISPDDVGDLQEDKRNAAFTALANSGQNAKSIAKSYEVIVESLSLLNARQLKRIWGISSREEFREKYPLADLFAKRANYVSQTDAPSAPAPHIAPAHPPTSSPEHSAPVA